MLNASGLAGRVFEDFQTRDVFEITRKAGLKIIFQNWFPVTAGEIDYDTKTIYVNGNANFTAEKIVAHELGHYFLRQFDVKNVTDEESFCDEFADYLRQKPAREQGCD